MEKSGPLSRGGFRKQHFLKKTDEHLSDTDLVEMKDEDKVDIPDALPWLLATLRDELAKLYAEIPQKKPTLKRKAPQQPVNTPTPTEPIEALESSHSPTIRISGPFDTSDYMIATFSEALEDGDWRDDDTARDRFKDLSPPRRAVSATLPTPKVPVYLQDHVEAKPCDHRDVQNTAASPPDSVTQ